MKKTKDVHTEKRKIFSTNSLKNVTDVTIIKKHILSLDNKAIKRALIANGIYDSNMKLTASFR
jgi:hypothetical protein